MKQQIGLYIHIPFCVQKCLYCDFLSFSGCPSEVQKDYVDALQRELDSYRDLAKDYRVASVFVGGGTPSSLKEGMLAGIFSRIYEVFNVNEDAEITIECNPGTLDRDKLEEYYACKVNRISFGLQSANNEELKRIGRIHNYEQFVANYMLAREIGFRNINVDIMSALPGQNLTSYGRTLAKVLELNPEHISAYSLIVEEGTPLSGNRELLETLPNEQIDRKMYQYTQKIMHSMGYERYEISNYAKPGFECRHNLGYWKGTAYLGIGLGAASYFDNRRWHNTTDFDRYKQYSGDRFKLREDETEVSMKGQIEEYMFLGLRCMKGISKTEFQKCFGYTVDDLYGNVIREYVEQGFLKVYLDSDCNEWLALTEKGIDVSNYILADFLLEEELEKTELNTLK